MKRVFRDSFNGILGGVCSGLGEYFEIDPDNHHLIDYAVEMNQYH